MQNLKGRGSTSTVWGCKQWRVWWQTLGGHWGTHLSPPWCDECDDRHWEDTEVLTCHHLDAMSVMTDTGRTLRYSPVTTLMRWVWWQTLGGHWGTHLSPPWCDECDDRHWEDTEVLTCHHLDVMSVMTDTGRTLRYSPVTTLMWWVWWQTLGGHWGTHLSPPWCDECDDRHWEDTEVLTCHHLDVMSVMTDTGRTLRYSPVTTLMWWVWWQTLGGHWGTHLSPPWCDECDDRHWEDTEVLTCHHLDAMSVMTDTGRTLRYSPVTTLMWWVWWQTLGGHWGTHLSPPWCDECDDRHWEDTEGTHLSPPWCDECDDRHWEDTEGTHLSPPWCDECDDRHWEDTEVLTCHHLDAPFCQLPACVFYLFRQQLTLLLHRQLLWLCQLALQLLNLHTTAKVTSKLVTEFFQ